MLNRLILIVTKFQLRPPKHLGIVVKNIFFWGGACQIGVRQVVLNRMEKPMDQTFGY